MRVSNSKVPGAATSWPSTVRHGAKRSKPELSVPIRASPSEMISSSLYVNSDGICFW
jgi:hypothetical protein